MKPKVCTEVISCQHNNTYMYNMNCPRVRSKYILEQNKEETERGHRIRCKYVKERERERGGERERERELQHHLTIRKQRNSGA